MRCVFLMFFGMCSWVELGGFQPASARDHPLRGAPSPTRARALLQPPSLPRQPWTPHILCSAAQVPRESTRPGTTWWPPHHPRATLPKA